MAQKTSQVSTRSQASKASQSAYLQRLAEDHEKTTSELSQARSRKEALPAEQEDVLMTLKSLSSAGHVDLNNPHARAASLKQSDLQTEAVDVSGNVLRLEQLARKQESYLQADSRCQAAKTDIDNLRAAAGSLTTKLAQHQRTLQQLHDRLTKLASDEASQVRAASQAFLQNMDDSSALEPVLSIRSKQQVLQTAEISTRSDIADTEAAVVQNKEDMKSAVRTMRHYRGLVAEIEVRDQLDTWMPLLAVEIAAKLRANTWNRSGNDYVITVPQELIEAATARLIDEEQRAGSDLGGV